MTLTVGSLFSGIGGLDLGLERAGFEVKWQVEIDDYCNKVLNKHWPDVPKFRDVRSVGAHNLPAVDLICGGFPCQDISFAGTGTGITGSRSGLWSEFARLINELRPRYAVVENVSALLVRGMGRVLGDLAAIGYDAEWHCIPAIAVGAPHIRDRVFIVAHASEVRCNTTQILTRERLNRFTQTSRGWWSNGHSHGYDGRTRPVPDGVVWGVDHGIPVVLERLGGLGNAVVPQVAELIGHAIMEHAL